MPFALGVVVLVLLSQRNARPADDTSNFWERAPEPQGSPGRDARETLDAGARLARQIRELYESFED